MNEINQIGRIIYFHRKASGLSRHDLADIADVGKTVIFDIEKGKKTVKINTLFKVMSALNIHIVFESPLMDKFWEQNNEES